MKPKEPLDDYKKKRKLKKSSHSVRDVPSGTKGDEWDMGPDSDYPVHEKYTQEEPVKE